MEIREPHSIGKLFLESFSVTNRAFGRLVVYFALAIGGLFVLGLLSLVGFPRPIVGIFNAIYSAFLSVLLFKIFAAQIEMDLASLADLLSSSALAAVYTMILGLIWGVIAIVAGFVLMILTKLFSPRILLLALPVGMFFGLRLMFAPISIALRDQGPIHAIMYSWQLTRGHFFRALLAFIMFVLVPPLVVYGIGYGLYVGIPLYFADSFNLAHLSVIWWGILALLLILVFFVMLSMTAFWVLVFLNLDYTEGEAAESQVLQTPQLHDNGTSLSSGAAAMASKNTQAPNVQVLHASVKTHSADESLDKHLNEVFQPLPPEQISSTEEDRMPTIVFDDDMAAQLQKEREDWEQAQKNKKRPNDNGEDSVKMSK